jgi:DNA transposition AAA+ family ATPase
MNHKRQRSSKSKFKGVGMQQIRDCRAELDALLKNDKQITQAAVARAIGSSSATISQYVAGKYPGDTKRLDKDVSSFIDNYHARRAVTKTEIPFIETEVYDMISEVAYACRVEQVMGVAYGDSGLGKTEALRLDASRNSGTILIEADLGYTARDLFRELSRRLVGSEVKGTLHELLDICIEKLKDSGRLLIIDEAEHLPYRALEMIRRIHDKANVGILLCGMKRLIENLRGKRGDFEQIYSRIDYAVALPKLGLEDTEKIIRSTIGSPAAGITKAFYDQCRGNIRTLCKLIRKSVRVAARNDRELSPEIINKAATALLI